MHDRDPAKRIPKSLGTDTKLFGTYTLADLAVVAFPGVLVVLGTQVVLPSSLTVAGHPVQTLALPLAGLAVGVGALFVYLTPAYASSVDWVATFVGFHTNATTFGHEEAGTYTQVERVHPKQGAIERTDGAVVGMVQVDPPSMALATDAEWRSKAAAFQDFLNTTVEFPIQVFSITQDFPVEEYLARYEGRLDDPDVAENSQLAALIEHYVEWYATALEQRQMTIRDHYVVVTVTPAEVRFEQDRLVRQLASLPVVGLAVRAWVAPSRGAERAALFDALDERLRQVERGLRDIEGCDARRLDVEDAARRIGQFWTGEPLAYDDIEQALRTRPIVDAGRAER